MKKNYLLLTVLLSIGLGIAATPNPKPSKPSAGDQKLLAKVYRVPCLDCDEAGNLKYRLKPLNMTITGSRSVPNGFVREITLHFKCPVRHEFSAPGPEQFVPAIRAEEEK